MAKINETIRVEKMKKKYMYKFSKNYRSRLIEMSRVGVICEQKKNLSRYKQSDYYYTTLFYLIKRNSR